MSRKFDGVAFDLDGTLYPNYRFYFRLIPFIIREHRLLMAFGKARSIFRHMADNVEDQGAFYDIQARIMSRLLNADEKEVKDKVDSAIYKGWEPLFEKIKLYPHVRNTLASLREHGLKLGLLSDFPPEKKLEHLRLDGFWDTVLCSERAGRLKPDPVSFVELIDQMGIPPERLLYVGNSMRYDIAGAQKSGIKAALVCRPLKRKILFGPFHKTGAAPDFVFFDYRQLHDYVLRYKPTE
jgi:putative hydrolase of the HAD superfamily